jgi:hypothetical protein
MAKTLINGVEHTCSKQVSEHIEWLEIKLKVWESIIGRIEEEQEFMNEKITESQNKIATILNEFKNY